jgi:antitoxin PrlF
MEPDSKIQRAEKLLSRPQGATMDEVAQATGDVQYNVLRRLQARGYSVRKQREGRTTRYWVSPPPLRAFELTISPNGQTTLPKEVRQQFGVTHGGKVRLVLEESRKASLAPATLRLRDLRSILPKARQPATLEEIEDGIAKGATDA